MYKTKDVMTHQVDVISPEASIAEAALRMRTGDFGLLPVGENDRMIGAISDRDIVVRAVAQGKSPDTQVREIMSEGILWAYDDDSVEDAVKIMGKHQVRRLPIINHDKRLVGIVALGDLAVNKAERQPAAKALAEISA